MSDSATRPPSRLSTALALIAALVVGLGSLLGLSRYGIWDPWELAAADAARALAEGTAQPEAPFRLGPRIVALGFSVFGVSDWAGRLPIAALGLTLPLLTFFLVQRFCTRRVATYAALALVTTPFFVLHARLMLGATPAFLASTLVFWGAASAVFPAQAGAAAHPRAPYAWLAVSVLGGILGALSSGVLLSVLPALGAVSVVTLLLGAHASADKAQKHARIAVLAATAAVLLLVVRAVFAHAADYSLWLGGVPSDGSVPTYERSVEQLFHSFAPWSALLPVALGALLRLDVRARSDQPLRLLVVAWAALAYAAQSLFISSYGSAAFPAPVALAIAVALWLGDRDEERTSFWPETVLSVLLVGLIIRDFGSYPASPLSGLSLGEIKLSESFDNPKRTWALILAAFAGALILSSLSVPSASKPDLQSPYRAVRELFARSLGHKIWLLVAALTLLALLAFGVAAFIPATPMTSLARRIGRAAFVIPLAIPVVVAVGQLAFGFGPRLASLRHGFLWLTALGLFGYTSFGFLPVVSEQFSPRQLFEVYNRLAKADEVLVQHQVPSGAAHYYARGEVREMASRSALIDYLSDPSQRRWAAFPVEQLSEIDHAFRRRTGRHLFVPGGGHANIALACSQTLTGEKDQNPLSAVVLKQAPAVQFPVNARFEDKIELIGYNLELPAKTYVGPGQAFHVTWFFRALQSNSGTYKVFVHIDAANQRIPGDHEPVDGKYPVRLWDEGDVIVDRQEISVPATSRPAAFTIYMGFFRGETRLKVSEGSHDGADRLRVGTLEVR